MSRIENSTLVPIEFYQVRETDLNREIEIIRNAAMNIRRVTVKMEEDRYAHRYTTYHEALRQWVNQILSSTGRLKKI